MQSASNLAENIVGQHPVSTPSQPQWDTSQTMHALTWRGAKKIEYSEVPRPTIADPRDVILRVTATTICGSDLHMYSGSMPNMKDGDILGHEFMGIVEQVGSQVSKLSIGQRVVAAFDIACGQCEYCKREEYTACDTTNPSALMEKLYGHRTSAIFGYSHLTGGVPGGQSEYVRVPFADFNCLPVPNDVPDEKALYLSDIIPTAYHGVEMGGVKEGDSVAIWGLGPVGLLIARWAQIRKAGRIIGIDCVPERLEKAMGALGIEVIDFKSEDVCKTLAKMVPGGVDVAIDAAGYEGATTWKHKIEMSLSLETDSCDILTECITSVRKFGTISIIGVYAGTTNHFPIGALMEKGLTVRGGQSPTQKYWNMALKKLQTGEFDPSFVVTHKGKLSQGPELFHKFYNREDGIIKIFMRPDSIPSL